MSNPNYHSHNLNMQHYPILPPYYPPPIHSIPPQVTPTSTYQSQHQLQALQNDYNTKITQLKKERNSVKHLQQQLRHLIG